ncbi:PPR_2 domain-containing protein [Cephalotus follicularis]|uniref:PPR_2 domain-containing protein n=1 Tax=Cephalotus follicularis TaxID=3775 RepID=A0A1Q3BXF3_CEPFO|nr:PPR_2 domain-containing protein [Cephalotus follicularis]
MSTTQATVIIPLLSTTSLAAQCTKKPHKTISHSVLTQKTCIKIPFSTITPTPSQETNNNRLHKLDHKDWLSPNDILKIFENLKDPNSIIPVFNQYYNCKDYRHTELLFTLVINKLAHANNSDAIDSLMQTIKHQKGCRLSDDFFYNVIKIYGHLAGRINRAIECESGNLSATFYVLDEFPKQRCIPNVRTFSMLMHGLCEGGMVEEAFELFDRIERDGIDPDTITFNILISGLRIGSKVGLRRGRTVRAGLRTTRAGSGRFHGLNRPSCNSSQVFMRFGSYDPNTIRFGSTVSNTMNQLGPLSRAGLDMGLPCGARSGPVQGPQGPVRAGFMG